MFYVDTEARGSSSFGRYYIISIAVSMVISNGGAFMMLFPHWARNIALMIAAMVYFGHLTREWWKLFCLSQTKRLTATYLLINAMFFGISVGNINLLAISMAKYRAYKRRNISKPLTMIV